MINIFKKLLATSKPNRIEMNRVIDEIHDTFYTEVYRILEIAKICSSEKSEKNSLIEKRDLLIYLGFTSTKEVKEANEEIERISKIQSDNKTKENLIEAINYFSSNYPYYKFITEDSVKKICAKYNLVYSSVDRYIGDVPDKNLEHIKNFKIKDIDSAYFLFRIHRSFEGRPIRNHSIKSYADFVKFNHQNRTNDMWKYFPDMREYMEKCPMEICAPVKDFNTQGMNVMDFKLTTIEILDPVVLYPVMYKNTKHYLIVTAWGQEASDEDVINPINN